MNLKMHTTKNAKPRHRKGGLWLDAELNKFAEILIYYIICTIIKCCYFTSPVATSLPQKVNLEGRYPIYCPLC